MIHTSEGGDKMELGNLIFGNSRGAFRIERGQGWEAPLAELLEAAGLDHYGHNQDPKARTVGFKNSVFEISPYYWGDCDCGFDDKESAWNAENDHREACYQVSLRLLEQENSAGASEQQHKSLCEDFGISWEDGLGSAIHCTCDFEQRWQNFVKDLGHSDQCSETRPNFRYIPTDFEISWYKYPLRDSYCNREISRRQFQAIVDGCLDSLSREPEEKVSSVFARAMELRAKETQK